MNRLRMSGLGLLVSAALLLSACSAQDAPSSQSISSTRPFASTTHLLRLANYEQGSKTDIVTDLEAGAGDRRHHLTPNDQVAKVTALWHAISGGAVGRQITWSNLDTGSHGYAEIMREVQIPDSDRVCREYREAFVIAGRSESEMGQACQLRDGSWWKIEG
jgi:surface antigen